MSAGPTLAQRTGALGEAVALADGRLAPALLEDARDVLDHASSRTALSAEHTVVALAGSTGSGKSSLFNALARTDLARTGVQRPTTSRATALTFGPPATALLDWLEVGERHEDASTADVAGLVLLDLPDHDSVVTEHRSIAARLVDRVDLLVWVVDPQKYADAVLHERFLRPLAGHDDVVVVVLNQIDRLGAAEAEACLGDLRRLVADDGLVRARVLGVSARTGAGLAELRELLAGAARRREAATARLVADVRDAARAIEAASGPRPVTGDAAPARHALADALAGAAGVPTVVDAVRRSTLSDARAATGWPPTRWLGRLRANPLRRLHLRSGPTAPEHTSLPVPAPTAAAAARLAVREYAEAATARFPVDWALAATSGESHELAARLDRAVAETDLETRTPRWWAVANVAQWVLLAAVAVGLAWLGLVAVLGYLQLPEPDLPRWLGLPVPTLLVLAGLGLGAVLTGLARWGGRMSARRRAAQVDRRLRGAVERVADEVSEPLAQERERLARCRAAAALAAS